MPLSIRKTFTIQAEACEALGSPFTASLCRRLGGLLDRETAVGRLCLDWQGDPGPSADSIPLRLCGGLHALVLTGADETLAGHYPPTGEIAPPGEVIANALITHEDYLIEWMKSPPQTNEVSRSAVIWPAFMTLAGRVNMPLRLLEVGASGGLNLNAHRFSYRLGTIKCGVENSPLRLEPKWHGTEPDFADVNVASSEGCDINPLDPASDHDALRLRAYVWPDQRARKERLNSALQIARNHPVPVERADAVDWLSQKLADPIMDVCTVIYSTIAWQYMPDDARAAGKAVIIEATSRATEDAPLAWVRFEADGETPGAGIRLQLWPHGIDATLGRADFHGRWGHWTGLN